MAPCPDPIRIVASYPYHIGPEHRRRRRAHHPPERFTGERSPLLDGQMAVGAQIGRPAAQRGDGAERHVRIGVGEDPGNRRADCSVAAGEHPVEGWSISCSAMRASAAFTTGSRASSRAAAIWRAETVSATQPSLARLAAMAAGLAPSKRAPLTSRAPGESGRPA
jgi:hypothetical protein